MISSEPAFEAYRREHPRSVALFQPELRLLAGAERSLLALARSLHDRGHDVHLVTYANTCDFAQFAGFALPVFAIAPEANFAGRILALRRVFRGEATNIPPLVSGYQGALHAALAGIGTFHCLMHDTPALFHDEARGDAKARLRVRLSNAMIGRAMRRGSGRMIVTSEFLRDDCARIFDITPEIARMGGMGDRGLFRPRVVAGELHLLSVSRIEANKRIDWTLDALAAMEHGSAPLSERVDWRFDLAGQGEQLDAMRARVEELGLAARVHFHGFVPDDELARLYDGAHLFLMPAVQGYGIPAIEALGRGIPVLLHRESGVSDVLRETPWAFVVSGGKREFAVALEAAVKAVVAGEHLTAKPPELPSEAAWAERVAALCGYA